MKYSARSRAASKGARATRCRGYATRAIAWRSGAKLVNMEFPNLHAGVKYLERAGKATFIGVITGPDGKPQTAFLDGRAGFRIDELEEEKRGPYAGCLGYFSYNGDMDMCITIRTLFSDSRRFFLQAGAGIVKDSVPEKEHQEC